MEAVFPDGDVWEVSDLTVEEWEKGIRPSSKTLEPLWSSTLKPSGHKLTIRLRQDRQVLMSLSEQRRQVPWCKNTVNYNENHKQI